MHDILECSFMFKLVLRYAISAALAFVLACQFFMIVIMYYVSYTYSEVSFTDLLFSEDVFKGVFRYFETMSSFNFELNYITLAYTVHAICMRPLFWLINKVMKRLL